MREPIIRGISFERAVFDQLEEKRGLVPRSTYLNDLLRKTLPGMPTQPR